MSFSSIITYAQSSLQCRQTMLIQTGVEEKNDKSNEKYDKKMMVK